MSKVKIYSDGASRGNPGEAGIGVVIYSEVDEKVKEVAEYIGIKTNNVAEYQALIRGLEEAIVVGATEVHAFADSELMVKQMKGEYKVKNAGLQPLYQKAKLLSLKFFGFQISHVPREKNKEADLLANEGIDRKSNPATKINSKKSEQVVLAFEEPSLAQNNSSEDFIVSGKNLALEKIELEKGQGKVFTDVVEEQIVYVLEGKLNYGSKESTKLAQKGDAFILTSDKCSCVALENTLLLGFLKLPLNRF